MQDICSIDETLAISESACFLFLPVVESSIYKDHLGKLNKKNIFSENYKMEDLDEKSVFT